MRPLSPTLRLLSLEGRGAGRARAVERDEELRVLEVPAVRPPFVVDCALVGDAVDHAVVGAPRPEPAHEAPCGLARVGHRFPCAPRHQRPAEARANRPAGTPRPALPRGMRAYPGRIPCASACPPFLSRATLRHLLATSA